MTYNFVKKETPTQVFSCEFFEIFKKIFFIEYLWMIAFEYFNVCKVSFGRSSRSQMFSKVGVLKSFAIFTGKQLSWSFFLIKSKAFRPATLLKGDSTQMFSCENCEILAPLAASDMVK